MTAFFDAHNHLQDEWLAPHRATVLADLKAAGVAGAVVNGTSEADWADVTALAQATPTVIPSYGLHPWDVGNRSPDWQGRLSAALAAGDAVLAARPLDPAAGRLAKVGEIGLDRWILDRAKPDDPRLAGLRRAPLEEQREVFAWQLALAASANRAVSIHCLDAFGALLEVLQSTPRPARGFLLHAYGGSADMVPRFAELGAYFSFNGAFLDARHAAKQAVYRAIPADRLLVETDAPAMPLPPAAERFMLPAGPGGVRLNHPANLAAAYTGLATLRGQDPAELSAAVAANFHRLFG